MAVIAPFIRLDTRGLVCSQRAVVSIRVIFLVVVTIADKIHGAALADVGY